MPPRNRPGRNPQPSFMCRKHNWPRVGCSCNNKTIKKTVTKAEHPLLGKKPKKVVIHYDNGQSWTTRELRNTNAGTVGKSDQLMYEERAPTVVDRGLMQRAEFAVDMVDVICLEITLYNGDQIIRKFKADK